MASPSISDVHISVPLSNISIEFATSNEGYVATNVFPTVPVKHKVDQFRTYDRRDKLRDGVKPRAPGTESVGGGWKLGDDVYKCDVYAYHVDLDDQTRDNSDSDAFSLDADAAEFVGKKGAISRELKFMDAYFKPGVWSSDYTGAAAAETIAGRTEGVKAADTGPFWDKYDDADDTLNSHPFETVENDALRMRILTGERPNTIVITRDLYNVLKRHPDFLDLTTTLSDSELSRYPGLQAQLAKAFEVQRLIIADGVYNDSDETLTVADNKTINMAGNKFIAAGGQMLLCYVAPRAGLNTASAGYVFEWTGYRNQVSNGIKTKKFRIEKLESDRIEISMAYGMEQVASDMGSFYTNMITP